MKWISVDDSQPENEAVVLVCGTFRGKRYISLGKYFREDNWWLSLAESCDFIMIEMREEDKKTRDQAIVLFWSPLEFPHEMD